MAVSNLWAIMITVMLFFRAISKRFVRTVCWESLSTWAVGSSRRRMSAEVFRRAWVRASNYSYPWDRPEAGEF
jgi:hypothetical protein